MKKLKDPYIAMVPFNSLTEIKTKIDKTKWFNFINLNKDYYTWFENTSDGIQLIGRFDTMLPVFKELNFKTLLNHNCVKAEFNNKKGYYIITINYNEEYGIISTTFEKKITKIDLQRLLNMAKYLDAYLLNHGTQIIDEKIIENYK